MAKKTYVANWHIKTGGKLVEPGARIKLDDDDAAQLGEAVTAASAAKEEAEPAAPADAQQPEAPATGA